MFCLCRKYDWPYHSCVRVDQLAGLSQMQSYVFDDVLETPFSVFYPEAASGCMLRCRGEEAQTAGLRAPPFHYPDSTVGYVIPTKQDTTDFGRIGTEAGLNASWGTRFPFCGVSFLTSFGMLAFLGTLQGVRAIRCHANPII